MYLDGRACCVAPVARKPPAWPERGSNAHSHRGHSTPPGRSSRPARAHAHRAAPARPVPPAGTPAPPPSCAAPAPLTRDTMIPARFPGGPIGSTATGSCAPHPPPATPAGTIPDMASRVAAAALTAAAAASLASAASLRVWRDGAEVPLYYDMDNDTATAQTRRLQTTQVGTLLTTSAAYTGQQTTSTGGTTTFSFQVVDSTLPVTLTFDDYKTGAIAGIGGSGNKCVTAAAAATARGRRSRSAACGTAANGFVIALPPPMLSRTGTSCGWAPPRLSATIPSRRPATSSAARATPACAARTTSSPAATWPSCGPPSRTRATGSPTPVRGGGAQGASGGARPRRCRRSRADSPAAACVASHPLFLALA